MAGSAGVVVPGSRGSWGAPPRSRWRRQHRAPRLLYGRGGWGCWPRVPWLEGTQDETAVAEETARLEVPRITASIWLLYEDGPGQWEWFERQFGRRDPEVFAGVLSGAGCRRVATEAFHWIRVDRFDCDRAGGRPGQPAD